MKTVEERLREAEAHCKSAEHQQRVRQRQEREAKKKAERLRNMRIGELACASFPVLEQLKTGTEAESKLRFAGLEAVLKELAAVPEFHTRLEEAVTASPAGVV